jgi:hypothetical protein
MKQQLTTRESLVSKMKGAGDELKTQKKISKKQGPDKVKTGGRSAQMEICISKVVDRW